jgi:hypothetical protein
VAGAIAFAVVATLNAGGYRYGASDQAFYIPAILHHLDPTLFPRDWAMLGAQGRFFVVDEIVAALVGTTGLGLPFWFAAFQLATLGALFYGGLAVGRQVLVSPWALTAWIAVLTLRHRIAKTGVNTLEAYFHPRMLVFGLGLTSLALFLRGRPWWALTIAAASGVVHPTTAALFVGLLTVALVVSEPGVRTAVTVAGAAVVVAIGGGIAAGVFDVSTMDESWVSLISAKDYVFPTRWSLETWAVNLLGPTVLVVVVAARRRGGAAGAREIGLAAGCVALVGGFFLSLPLIANGVALAVQLQTSRVFWPVEVVASLYLVWALVDRTAGTPARAAMARALAMGLMALAVGRGVYVGFLETPGRATFAWTLPDDDWTRALGWIRTNTPADAFVLADPGHAWKPGMGTAVRIAAERDVFLEDTKDVAMAMYSRETARRIASRIADAQLAVGGDVASVTALAARSGLSVYITDRAVELPILFRSGPIRVYALAAR